MPWVLEMSPENQGEPLEGQVTQIHQERVEGSSHCQAQM
jgi:hypothetical protein